MGQGNKNRRPGSINKGYGPGSGRGGFGGFKGAGIGGNVGGGFGKGDSPSGSGKNNSGQGGNNPFSKGGDKGFGDKGQLSFSGLKNFFSGFLGSPAHALGTMTGLASQATKAPPSQAKINRFLAKNIDITDMNPSFRVNIDGERALKGFTSKIPNEKIRNWVNNWTPSAVKNLKINHQMYSPTKIKPTDPRYNPTGTGSAKMDPKAERYLEWMARQNPKGTTVSEYKKLYAKHLKDGRFTLQQVMRLNPAETMPFYALIDDTQKTPESKNNFLKIIRAKGTPYAKDNFLKQIRTQPNKPPVIARPLPLPMPRDLSGDTDPKNIPKIPIALPTQPAVPPSNSLNNFLKIIRR